MAAPPVEGGPCVRGPACLMGIRHAANGRAARGAHGSGVQRPGWRSLGRSMDQCHLNWVCTECAQRSHQGPDPSIWSGEGPRSSWSDRVFRCAEGLPLQRAAQVTATNAQDMAGQVPLDPPAQACKMQLHICQLPMSGGDGPPPSSPGIAGAGRPLRRLGGFGDEGEPPPAPALHALHLRAVPLTCTY